MKTKAKPTIVNDGESVTISRRTIPQQKEIPMTDMGRLGWSIAQSKEHFIFLAIAVFGHSAFPNRN